MSDNVTYTFDMEFATHAKLKKIADDEHRTLAGQIRLILEDWLEKQK
jgi:hypothetical protein